MGVYIKDMKLPHDCDHCELRYDNCACIVTGARFDFEKSDKQRLPNCPLIEVPEPHGRLGDLDALCEGRLDNDNVFICAKIAPAVIPASEEGEA